MKERLEEIMKWSSVSNKQIDYLYKVYYEIYDNDKTKYCRKCPAVIRNIFYKVKRYYATTYEKK